MNGLRSPSEPVLGISALFHDSAAALVDGEAIIAAAQEERFTRIKNDWRFPDRSIDFCLSHLLDGTSPAALAYYENPVLKMDRIFRCAADNAPRGATLWPQTLLTLKQLDTELPNKLRSILDDPNQIYFVPHHRSHAASAYYPSPFDTAAILVVDGVGEWSTTSIWAGEKGQLAPLKEVRFPHSLGLFYSAITQYCGFKVNSGEYKLMGLSPFGRPVYRDLLLDEIICLKDDGSFALDLKYFEFHAGLTSISPLLGYLLGQHARHPKDPITQHYMDVAASAQAVIEAAMIALSREALRLTGMRNLCLAGGVALNCVANSAIYRDTPDLDDIWVQPAAGDAGGALGAALDVARKLSPLPPISKKRDSMQGAYLGPDYSESEIELALRQNNLTFERCSDDAELCDTLADALADRQLVGHFDGAMEFGPRALGNRSIIADPWPVNTLRRVNLHIKFREAWRPFAPIVLEDHADDYFDNWRDSPYMLFVADMKPSYRTDQTLQKARNEALARPTVLQDAVKRQFSAINHIDYSARLQTVSEESPSRIYRILRKFHEKTGRPMLLNTSFNVRGEPIVNSPLDAVECFLNTRLDLLVIGPFLVRKADQSAEARAKAGKTKFDAD